MFNWLFSNRGKSSPDISELAMRAKIAHKLKNYNPEEDTTISEFSLADDDEDKKTAEDLMSAKNSDIWGPSNPRRNW
ncbi:MAG: hypothetical protein GY806_06105 [Gammaproteobacteria bacterium]|nr:hypothetical protein [Gammaproteobacteria bacterium]